jgi:predicted GNAT family N-acyltransferase
LLDIATANVLKIQIASAGNPAIRDIRTRVFHHEQGIDPALEFDGYDDTATHFLAYADTLPVGTTRLRHLSDRTAKIERLAVLPHWRRRGIARQLMETAIAHLERDRVAQIVVHAQAYVVPFYQKLGFQLVGKPFEEAGIPHHRLERWLIPPP